MKVTWMCAAFVSVVAALALCAAEPADTTDDVKVGEYRLSGPYEHENLAIFLVHGKDKLKGKEFITLKEALEQKKVILRETGNVGTLIIENVSGDVHIYIDSGDIVRGGKQDRVIGYDFVVPPRSGKMPLKSFCVERARWSRRGGESAAQFSASGNRVSSKELRLAVRHKSSQGEVWKEVAHAQDKLSANVGTSVRSEQSATSLELTLEDENLKRAVEGYLTALSPVTEGKEDVIGFAFAVNGELNSADIYASSALFKKLWPKLLKASAVEAIAELQKGKEFEHVAAQDVKAFLEDARKGKASEKQISDELVMITHESDASVVFETRQAGDDQALHESYVRGD